MPCTTGPVSSAWVRHCDEAQLLSLLSLAPDAATAAAWAVVSPCLVDLPTGPYAESIQAWDAYCEHVRGTVEGDTTALPQSTVFGTCGRCGSSRLLVTNKQLRRADEGMARGVCTSRVRVPVRDGAADVQGLWPHHAHQFLTA
jgi:hypothetical protein